MVATAVLATARSARAWVYPEHREIALLAVTDLDPARRAVLDRLWAEARTGHEARLCASAADVAQDGDPACLDWAAWAAISGDHSCSAAQMLHTVLDSRWIMNVAAVAARLGEHLAAHGKSSWRFNLLQISNIQLQRADPQYSTRAESNNAHFLLARPSVGVGPDEYLALVLAAGVELNAVGTYIWYHARALQEAARLAAAAGMGAADRAALARATLADEAFAVHFLEDPFAAGHAAGSWGQTTVRKGTHDYYNEHGLEVVTWRGKDVVLMGDGFMRPEDARRASATVRASLAQVLDAAAASPAPAMSDGGAGAPAPGDLDVCRATGMPAISIASGPSWQNVLADLPTPGLAEGLGARPRFHTEMGPFFGVAAAAQIGAVDRGFEISQTTPGVIGSLQADVRVGLGLQGVMDQSGDGLVFLDAGLRLDTSSTMDFSTVSDVVQGGAITAAFPARPAITIRARAPFWLIPGDMLLAALLVAPFSRATYLDMAVLAANGGLIPWQSGITTPVGRFQVVLGREVGVSLYGYVGSSRVRFLMAPAPPDTADARLVALRSVSFDFPVVEYRPFRSFTMDQTSILLMQLYAGFEVPGTPTVIRPVGASAPDLHTVFGGGLRVAFDWRRY